MKKLILDKKGIYEYQQNREPYLMIDYASEVIPGVSSKGYKDLKKDEWQATEYILDNVDILSSVLGFGIDFRSDYTYELLWIDPIEGDLWGYGQWYRDGGELFILPDEGGSEVWHIDELNGKRVELTLTQYTALPGEPSHTSGSCKMKRINVN